MRQRHFVPSLVVFCVVVVIVLPSVLIRGCVRRAPAPPEGEPWVVLYHNPTKSYLRLPLETYVAGVVAAEMPASFHREALMAQAVAARSYVWRRMRSQGGSGCELHPPADICADPTHCQAWLSPEARRSCWGLIEAYWNWRKISQVVAQTRGLVITYTRTLPSPATEVVDPVYHSTCGGATESSEDVWGSAVPYLRGVKCGFDQHSKVLHETRKFSYAEVKTLLGVDLVAFAGASSRRSGTRGTDVPASSSQVDPAGTTPLIRPVALTPNGRLRQVMVGDRVMSGTELRSALGLRSTLVTWRVAPDGISFTTTGYGHGVGMCQYGADGMARKGYRFDAILKHYYTGVEVRRAY